MEALRFAGGFAGRVTLVTDNAVAMGGGWVTY
jgi:hypothetical protein